MSNPLQLTACCTVAYSETVDCWVKRLAIQSLIQRYKKDLNYHPQKRIRTDLFTIWMTSSSLSVWSLPTFWGWCFTDEPHTNALKKNPEYTVRYHIRCTNLTYDSINKQFRDTHYPTRILFCNDAIIAPQILVNSSTFSINYRDCGNGEC